MFKISSGCHLKTCRSLKWRTILKIPSIFYRRTYAFSVGFKMKPLKKTFPSVKTKANSNFAVNLVEMLEEATIHFCVFDESHFPNICTF